jgi:hypothetical protein
MINTGADVMVKRKSNFGGKKAAPFSKSGRKKSSTKTARGTKKK